MSSITFTGAFIRNADLCRPKEGGPFARIHLTANLTKAVRDEMAWEELPDCLDSGKLDGELNGKAMILTPNADKLAKHEIQLECSEVNDFQMFHVRNKDGESKRMELRFSARCNEDGAIGIIEQYIRKIGDAPASLRITYASQQKLPMEPEKAEAAKA